MEVQKPTADVRIDALSSRESEVLRLVSEGATNREIGVSLGLSVHAVKFHLASVYRKLGVGNRTEAAVALLTTTDARSALDGD